VLGDQAELLGEVHAQVRHQRVHALGRAELEAKYIPGLGVARGVDRHAHVVADQLGQRALRPLAAVADARARQALAAHALDVGLELVAVGARQVRARRHHDRLHDLFG
jgi:hypothetical protein